MRRIFFIFKRVWKLDGALFFLSSVFYLVSNFVRSMCAVVLPAYISLTFTSEGSLNLVVAIIACMILAELISSIFGGVTNRIAFRYRLRECGCLNAASIQVPVGLVDVGDGKEMIERAQAAVSYGNDQGVEAFLLHSLSLLNNFFVLCGFVYLLRFVHFGFIVLALSFSVIHHLICNHMYVKSERMRERWLEVYDAQEELKRSIVASEHEKDIRINRLQNFLLTKLKKFQTECFRYTVSREKRFLRQSFSLAVSSLLRNIVLIVAFIYFSKDLTIDTLILYLGVIFSLDAVIENIFNSTKEVKEQNIHIDSLKSFYSRFEKVACDEGNTTEPNAITKIEIKDLSFAYGERSIIKNFSCDINKGEKIAIVGKNGAGKTTLIKLLCNFYEPSSGAINFYVGEKLLTKEKLLNYFSGTFQNTNLFAFNVFENIALVENDKTKVNATNADSEVKAVNDLIAKVGMGSKVKNINSYITTQLDENGIAFSGGEAARLLLARMLKKDASVYVMDELDAALDNDSQVELYKLLSEELKEKIVFFVSHRLTSVSFSDRIIFFNDNQELTIGTHNQLYNEVSEYKKMYDIETDYLRTSKLGEVGNV